MRYFLPLRTSAGLGAALTMVLCHFALGQEASRGLPPRATPADYQAHIRQATSRSRRSSRDTPSPPRKRVSRRKITSWSKWVCSARRGAPQLDSGDFSLRLNGKRRPSRPSHMAWSSSLSKIPPTLPPDAVEFEEVEGGSIPASGGGGQNDTTNLPPIIHIPIGVERAMEQKVQKASLPEGDRRFPRRD